MNHGPLIFLGVFATFVASWWGLVFAPYIQIGSEQAAQTDTGPYPNLRPGAASQGRQVYVANGCVHCHSQQIHQEGYTYDLVLTAVGTNPPRVAKLIKQIAPDANTDELFAKASDRLPQPIAKNIQQLVAEDAQKALKKAGATAQAVFIPLGADLGPGRQWGQRRTVAADYLYDSPVQVGNSRLGPDLSNYGNRAPESDLILKHLYDPRTTMPGSMMPAYRFLFETRAVGKRLSPNALNLPAEFAPKAGREVVPTTEALQLVAYLQSLRADTPLLEGPMTQIGVPSAPGATNAPATNAPAAAPKQ
jgi:cbb3-type cytochrome oxidase cytochrome c subunit